MVENITTELKKSPLSTMSALIGAIVGLLSLLIAWLQLNGSIDTSLQHQITSDPQKEYINISSSLLVIAFFISSTTASAFITKIILERHKISAYFISLTLATIINFLSIVIIYITPPKALNQNLFTDAHNLTLYTSAVIYLAFCGGVILSKILNYFNISIDKYTDSINNNNHRDDDIFVFIVGVGLLLLLWGVFVFHGQLLLAKTFLPELTYSTTKAL